MKTFAILSALIFGLSFANAQSSSKYTYLVVRIPNLYDKRLDSVYSVIAADVFWYTQNFYSHRTDSSKALYNFFQNTTEAMQFLSEHGWELISVNNDITSVADYHVSHELTLPYTVLYTSPVYYFRKKVK